MALRGRRPFWSGPEQPLDSAPLKPSNQSCRSSAPRRDSLLLRLVSITASLLLLLRWRRRRVLQAQRGVTHSIGVNRLAVEEAEDVVAQRVALTCARDPQE